MYRYLLMTTDSWPEWLLTYCPHKSRMLFIFAVSQFLTSSHPSTGALCFFGSTSHLVSVCLSTPESRWRNLSSSSSVISPWISEGKGNGESIEDLEEWKKEDELILTWRNTMIKSKFRAKLFNFQLLSVISYLLWSYRNLVLLVSFGNALHLWWLEKPP